MMKKFTIIIMLLFLISLISQAQNEYSMENLKQASQEDLNIYLDKAMKLKNNGKTVTIVGGALLGTGIIWGITDPLGHSLGTVMEASVGILGGLGAMAVGIPMTITGKKRVERINTISSTAFFDAKIELKPCVHYDLVTQNYQPGIIFKIKF